MNIYNFLFYKGYQLGLKSKNYADTPILAGIVWVALCFIFNLFTLFLSIEGTGLVEKVIPNQQIRQYRFILGALLVLALFFYYKNDNRYLKIIERYEKKELSRQKSLHPIVVILLYYVASILLLLIAGMYKNKDWIFG